MFQAKVVDKKHNSSFNIFFSDNRAVYEITWKNVVQPERPQMTIRRMRIACCITNATNTHSDYLTLLGNDQLDALFLNVSILCLYMFRAASAQHQEVQIVLILHLV
jgi:hypothetical protein